MNKHLVPDCGGLIRQVAMALPAAFFKETQPEDWFRPLIPIGNLLMAFPAEIDVFLVIDRASLDAGGSWADTLNAKCGITFIPSANPVASPWAQDAFLVRQETGKGDAVAEIVTWEDAGPGELLADFLDLSVERTVFQLPGGNQLVGQGFRLLGQFSVLRENFGGASAGHSPMSRLEQLQALDDRPIGIFGYRVGDLSGSSLPEEGDLGRSKPEESVKLAAEEAEYLACNGYQHGFHVDQFVSVTGLYRNGSPLLLVGEPCAVDGTINPLIDNARRQLDASVAALRRQGFAVLRNPVPYMIAPDSGKRLPRLYNNLILENVVRAGHDKPIVWLPQFSDVEILQEFDRLNKEIWEDVGFEVKAVPGWSYLASRNGAIRCISKVLQRKKIA